MRTLALVMLLLLLAAPAAAGDPLLVHVPARRALLRADSGSVHLIDIASRERIWTVPGVRHPGAIIASAAGDLAAVLDPIANEVAVIALGSGTAVIHPIPETPLAGEIIGDALYVLSRDAGSVTRIDSDGSRISSALPGRAGLLLAAGGAPYVYDRVSGSIVRLDPSSLEIEASGSLPPFASDLEAGDGTGYLVLPREGRLVAFSLESLEVTESRAAGAVPIDLQLERTAGALSGGTLAIADPSSKRVWRDEGAQSFGQALARGFLRGLLGLGLYAPQSAEFPTGVDRLFTADRTLWGFDSASGTLYRIEGERARASARGVSWGSFAVADSRVWIANSEGIESRPW
ncbi:MAG TPA: hypothetical protein VMS56_00905 [Thermoanaerobaculia bacterium]|nr:hypothetical protein [Thermoanaerobaculia bacterium]